MSFELVDTQKNLAGLRGTTKPEPGAFDNFLAGTARFTMKGFAQTGRAVSLAGIGAVSIFDKMAESSRWGTKTYLADELFRFHDDIFQSAVDAWTPKSGEVGVAAEVAGTLLSTLPIVIASPSLAVASTQLSVSEDLARKGVPTGKAVGVGAVQGAGLGLGVWMPILGQSGFQRMVVGGAGFNVAQGVVTRGVSGSILEGTEAANDFQAFDWSAITLDALLGLAFGGLTHLSPAQRKQGEAGWKRIQEWVSGARPSELDALVALRQSQHLQVDSAPGRLTTPEALDAHVTRARTALDQVANDRPVHVEDLPAVRAEPDPQRQAAAEQVFGVLEREASRAAKEHGIEIDPIRVDPADAVKTEAPAPKPDAAPKAGEEPARADPLAAEAERFAAAHPELEIPIGQGEDGRTVLLKAKEFLARAREEAKAITENSKLYEIAAACWMGRG